MGKQRKVWTVEQKLTIILAALREEQSVAQLARQHGVSEQQIYRWKAQVLDGGRQGLGTVRAARGDQRLQGENEQLKRLLGEKTLENGLTAANAGKFTVATLAENFSFRPDLSTHV
jgi:transposase-like protein